MWVGLQAVNYTHGTWSDGLPWETDMLFDYNPDIVRSSKDKLLLHSAANTIYCNFQNEVLMNRLPVMMMPFGHLST